MSNVTIKSTVDLQTVPTPQRHSIIFGTFPVDAVMIVNDHDPKSLLYQFQAELENIFDWECIMQGPEVWQVRIGRTAVYCT